MTAGLLSSDLHRAAVVVLTGTPSQIEWAERIRGLVAAEFDRVAAAFETVAAGQSLPARIDTHSILAILDEKRHEVMAHSSAGYFIREWQELNDQVRVLIAQDPRYQAIKAQRKIK